jgi:hypothetical protein
LKTNIKFCNWATVSRNRYGVEKTVDTNKILSVTFIVFAVTNKNPNRIFINRLMGIFSDIGFKILPHFLQQKSLFLFGLDKRIDGNTLSVDDFFSKVNKKLNKDNTKILQEP